MSINLQWRSFEAILKQSNLKAKTNSQIYFNFGLNCAGICNDLRVRNIQNWNFWLISQSIFYQKLSQLLYSRNARSKLISVWHRRQSFSRLRTYGLHWGVWSDKVTQGQFLPRNIEQWDLQIIRRKCCRNAWRLHQVLPFGVNSIQVTVNACWYAEASGA